MIEGILTLLVLIFLIRVWKGMGSNENVHGGPIEAPKYFRRSTPYAARQGRAKARSRKPPIDWGDDSWGW